MLLLCLSASTRAAATAALRGPGRPSATCKLSTFARVTKNTQVSTQPIGEVAASRASKLIALAASPPIIAFKSTATPRFAPIATITHILSTPRPYSTTATERSSGNSSSSPGNAAQLEKPPTLDPAESHVWDLLAAALTPTRLRVTDISGGCGSMYSIEVASAQFRDKNIVAQQRMVLAALKGVREGWHGVQIRTQVPSNDETA